MLYKYNMSTRVGSDKVFKALAAPIRRAMLDELKEAPRTTGDLCGRFADLDRCTVMQHLKVLEDADLVIAQRKGRERWNHLNAQPIRTIYERWIGAYTGTALDVMDRLSR